MVGRTVSQDYSDPSFSGWHGNTTSSFGDPTLGRPAGPAAADAAAADAAAADAATPGVDDSSAVPAAVERSGRQEQQLAKPPKRRPTLPKQPKPTAVRFKQYSFGPPESDVTIAGAAGALQGTHAPGATPPHTLSFRVDASYVPVVPQGMRSDTQRSRAAAGARGSLAPQQRRERRSSLTDRTTQTCGRPTPRTHRARCARWIGSCSRRGAPPPAGSAIRRRTMRRKRPPRPLTFRKQHQRRKHRRRWRRRVAVAGLKATVVVRATGG